MLRSTFPALRLWSILIQTKGQSQRSLNPWSVPTLIKVLVSATGQKSLQHPESECKNKNKVSKMRLFELLSLNISCAFRHL